MSASGLAGSRMCRQLANERGSKGRGDLTAGGERTEARKKKGDGPAVTNWQLGGDQKRKLAGRLEIKRTKWAACAKKKKRKKKS